jgi:uncharacterized protein involved in outer membrane biogenesis
MARSSAGGLRLGPGPRRRRWPGRLLIVSAIVLVVAAVLGAVVAPPIIRRVAEERLSALLGRRVVVSRVRVNPLTLAVTASGVRIFEPDGRTPFVGVARIRVDVEARSLVRRGLVVRELRLDAPRARVVREQVAPRGDPLAGYNFSDIVARLRVPPSGGAASGGGAPPRFSLSNIQVTDGVVIYEDHPTRTRHEVTALSLGIPFISTLPADSDVFVAPALSLRLDGTPFAIDGHARPLLPVREAKAHVYIAALEVPRWLPYLPLRLPVEVASAWLNVDLEVEFVRRRRAAPTLTLAGRVALERLAVRGPSGAPRARLDELEVVVKQIDLAAERFSFDAVRVKGLDVRARRGRDGTLDWQRLVEDAARARRAPRPHAPARAGGGPGPRVEIGEVATERAAVRLRDENVRPPIDVAVTPIDVTARHVSSEPASHAETSASLRVGSGVTLKARGSASLAPLAAEGTIEVDVREPGRLGPYLQKLVALDVPEGRLRVAGRYALRAGKGGARLLLNGVSLDVAGLVVAAHGGPREELLRVPQLRVRGGAIDLAARTVAIAAVSTRGGWLGVRREADGHLRLGDLLAQREGRAPPRRSTGPPEPPWSFKLARVDVEGWSARYEDRSVAPPVNVEVSRLAIHARPWQVTPRFHARAEIDVGVGERGRVAVQGTLGLEPLALDVRVNVTAMPVPPFQGYCARYERAILTSGVISASARLQLAVWRTHPGKHEERLSIVGDAELTDVAAVDERERKELARWRSLRIEGVDLSLHPLRLVVRDAQLTEPSLHVVIGPDGRPNLGPFGEQEPEPHPPVPAAESARVQEPPPPAIAIGDFRVRGGRVAFVDRSVRPPVFADAEAVDLHLSGLSSDASTRATTELRARIDRVAPLGVSGWLNPLGGMPSADLELSLRDLDLPPASPYAAKYIGHPVVKGKLDLGVRCRIDRGRLDSKAHVVIHHLELGPKVDSPHATHVPVKLAASVLEDRRGVIELTVPVDGTLDDPSFHLGRRIDEIFGAIVRKVLSSPFALIGAAFGGGGRGGDDELSTVDFAPGAASLDAAAATKVRALGRALHERRELSFEIEGGADPSRDRAALHRTLVARGEAEALLELARRRALAVRDALVHAAPDAGGRLFVVKPKVGAGEGSRVRLQLRR